MRPYVFGTYGPGRPHGFAGEVAVYSKLPLQEHPRIWAAGRMTCAFDVPVDGAPLRLLCLHAPRPTQRAFYDYDGFWKVITPEILALPDPAVVVGDFNATQYSAVYERLTADRLRSAHEDRGRGYATTWPNGAWPVPPIRIDQALLSPGVECVRITEGRGAGSDHKPLILDVQIRGRSASR
jgi:endonuclease/exonuclease/phosphatase (EEP) superfamily protein YafD